MPCSCFIARDTPTIEAHRWNQVVGDPEEVTGLNDGAEGDCEDCSYPLASHGILDGDARLVCPGDWIVHGETVTSMSPTDFEAAYEPR